MSVINPLARELSAKIVYYGPGLSGKTTSLAYIHSSLKSSHRGDLISLATEGDRTLFFDFLPVHLGTVQGLDLRLQIYTVPGQVFYGATRRLVLEGADGVVFVADSQAAAAERNLESLLDLQKNLEEFGTPLRDLPFVIQYNKRDLPNCLSVNELRAQLNTHGAEDFPTCASNGVGIADALKAVTRLVIAHLGEQAPNDNRRASLRQALPLIPEGDRVPDGQFGSQVSAALRKIAQFDGPHSSHIPPSGLLPDPLVPSLHDLGQSETPPKSVRISSRSPSPKPKGALEQNALTIQAPATVPYSFATFFPDPSLVRKVEAGIATGQFAEAVYHAGGGVSAMLDNLLGPYGAEGSATRAQLLGLDGHEYLKLRRLCSQPAAAISGEDALFALYVLVAVRVKETRLLAAHGS